MSTYGGRAATWLLRERYQNAAHSLTTKKGQNNMPRAKYQSIYRDMKQRIEAGERQAQDLLPSENTLVGFYGCSRNTVRRAIAALAEDGNR